MNILSVAQRLNNFFNDFENELKSSRNLRVFAFGLIVIHFLTALFWQQQSAVDIISNTSFRLCWPFLPNCREQIVLSYSQTALLLLGYVVAIFSTAFVYFSNAKRFWISLLILEFYKLFIQFLDYRFMGNYHFMPHILTLSFLFFSNRKTWAMIWLISFYWGAALLKINPEWLSGASLSWRVPFGSPKLLPYLSMMALLIEVNAPLAILIGRPNIRWLGLIALTLFHLVSFYWVGFFYPLVMLSVLTIFLPLESANSFKFSVRSLNFLMMLLIWFTFFTNQFFSVLDYRKTATDAEKRLASLNMFDALTNCAGFYLIHEKETTVQVPYPNQDLAIRVRCDNIIFNNYLEKVCSQTDKQVSAYLSVRVQSDTQWQNNFFSEDACPKKQ